MIKVVKAIFDYKTLATAAFLVIALAVFYVAYDNIDSKNSALDRANTSEGAAERAQADARAALNQSERNGEKLEQLLTETSRKDSQIAALVAENTRLREDAVRDREQISVLLAERVQARSQATQDEASPTPTPSPTVSTARPSPHHTATVPPSPTPTSTPRPAPTRTATPSPSPTPAPTPTPSRLCVVVPLLPPVCVG